MDHRRLIEVDLARTVAVLLMIIYHAAYDLRTFYGWDIDVLGDGWMTLAHAAASLFLLLVGVSFTLSFKRRFPGGASPLSHEVLAVYGRRAMLIMGLGIGLSVLSYAFDPDTYIRFGILHCIGIATVFLPFVLFLEERAALLGLGVILLGRMFGQMEGSSEALLALNIVPAGFSSIDYYPLAPWAGVILIGTGLGSALYGGTRRWRGLVRMAGLESRAARVLAWPGRNALWVYFVHQPVIMGVLAVMYGWPS